MNEINSDEKSEREEKKINITPQLAEILKVYLN